MHVLGLPPAFVLSQDQTLKLKCATLAPPLRYLSALPHPRRPAVAPGLRILDVRTSAHIVLPARKDSSVCRASCSIGTRSRQTVKLTPASSVHQGKPNGPIRERPDPSKWNRAARISLQIPVMSNSAGIIPQRQKPPRRANYRCATRPTLPIFRHPKPDPKSRKPGETFPKPADQNPGPEPNQASPPRRWSARYGESQLTASGFFRISAVFSVPVMKVT